MRAARRLLPPTATPIAARLLLARALRGFADGFTSVFLAAYLSALGFSPLEVGALVTAALLGSAALTLAIGLAAHRIPARRVLLAAAALMLATGLGFASATAFWTLLAIAFVGTLNPSAGDVSVFLPTEQSLLSGAVAPAERTSLFARYNVGGALLGALGALASGLPELAAAHLGVGLEPALRASFGIYAAAAVPIALLYRGLPEAAGAPHAGAAPRPLARSRRVVLELTALFSLDSFGGGFAVQSLLALWLFQRFDLSLAAAGAFFFAANLAAGLMQLFSARLAQRIGLVRTMVFTHLPANAFLIAAALMPTAPWAILCLLVRAALSQMDVPARQSLVMGLVPPEERAAAASVTNVPRSLATALAPLLAGALLSRTSFGWPLVLGGALKIAYDLLLLARFHATEPREEATHASPPHR